MLTVAERHELERLRNATNPRVLRREIQAQLVSLLETPRYLLENLVAPAIILGTGGPTGQPRLDTAIMSERRGMPDQHLQLRGLLSLTPVH